MAKKTKIITVPLTIEEMEALNLLADYHVRNPRDEARYLVVSGLRDHGMLDRNEPWLQRKTEDQ